MRVSLELIGCALACDHDDIAYCPSFRAVLAEQISPRVADAETGGAAGVVTDTVKA